MSQTDQLAINRIANAVEKIAEEGGGSGGGDRVEITPTLTEGTKIADFKINNVPGALYAPEGGSGGSAGYTSIIHIHEHGVPENSDNGGDDSDSQS